jgi:hypothetical protein
MKGVSAMSNPAEDQRLFRMILLFSAPNFVEAWQIPVRVLLEEQAELIDGSRRMTGHG